MSVPNEGDPLASRGALLDRYNELTQPKIRIVEENPQPAPPAPVPGIRRDITLSSGAEEMVFVSSISLERQISVERGLLIIEMPPNGMPEPCRLAISAGSKLRVLSTVPLAHEIVTSAGTVLFDAIAGANCEFTHGLLSGLFRAHLMPNEPEALQPEAIAVGNTVSHLADEAPKRRWWE